MEKTLGPQEYYCRKGKHTWIYIEWSVKTSKKTLTCEEHEKKITSISTPFSPSWKKYEKGIWSDNTKTSMEATDKFLAERDHAVRTDPRAAKWEASRKERVAKDKPAWVKMANERGLR